MRKLLATLAMFAATSAWADFRMIVPQEPGAGTSVWASIIARHLSKELGEPVTIQHIPGAKDIPGFNEFHNKLRKDPKVIMVSHGGNGISYLVDRVDYDYKNYDAIGMMNLNIIMGKKKGEDFSKNPVKMAGGSGMETDGMAIAMLICGNLPDTNAYLECWKKKVVWVNGLKGGERRTGFLRGEFNTTRESVAAWFKFYTNTPENELWFHHGIRDIRTGKQSDDANFPPGYQFEALFKKKYGVEPKGEFYEAYRLSRAFRDVIQKALWVDRGNPNTDRLRRALAAIVTKPDVLAEIEKDTGKYEWVLGEEASRVVNGLQKDITKSKLQTLVKWHDAAYGFKSVYKPELAGK
jgi:hypothetical protein